jgi:hypothetical protein
MADDAGIDFLLPIARWKGYGGDVSRPSPGRVGCSP